MNHLAVCLKLTQNVNQLYFNFFKKKKKKKEVLPFWGTHPIVWSHCQY